MDTELWIDIIGWIGSLEVILAYFLISNQKVKGDNLYYQLLNGTGAIFLMVNTVYYGSYPSTLINIVWLVIAITALIKMVKKKNEMVE